MGYLIAYLLGTLAAIYSKKNSANYSDQEASKREHPPVTDRPSPILSIPPSPTDQERTEQNRRKRREVIKFWTEIIGIFILAVYTGFTIATWWQVKKSTDAATDAANTAQKQLEESQRPWVKIIDVQPRGGSILGGLSFNKIGPYKDAPEIRVQATLQIKLSFSNIGHSVADVTPNLELFMPQFSSSEYWNRISAEEKRFCGSPDMSAVTAQKVTVFPDEPQPFDWSGGISSPIGPENINHLPEGSGVTPALIVCVSYRHKGLPSLYQTRAVYEISRLDTHRRFFDAGECNIKPFTNSPITFCEGGVSAELLKLDRNPMGDDAY